MKKILLSLGMITVVSIAAIGTTGAFFSDTETSTGNTFTAGAIDLKVDNTQHYNGNVCALNSDGHYVWSGNAPYPVPGSDCTGKTWVLKDLAPTVDKFFDFGDIKPGDNGEDTISLHVTNNDAYVCAKVSNLTNFENGQTEPEALVDSTTGVNDGELQSTMLWKVWRDDGGADHQGIAGDNIWQPSEQVLTEGHPANGVLPLYDSTTGTGPLVASSTAYLGVSWSLPATSGNETQTDSMTGDISFDVVQSRNNADFRCVPLPQPNPPVQ